MLWFPVHITVFSFFGSWTITRYIARTPVPTHTPQTQLLTAVAAAGRRHSPGDREPED